MRAVRCTAAGSTSQPAGRSAAATDRWAGGRPPVSYLVPQAAKQLAACCSGGGGRAAACFPTHYIIMEGGAYPRTPFWRGRRAANARFLFKLPLACGVLLGGRCMWLNVRRAQAARPPAG